MTSEGTEYISRDVRYSWLCRYRFLDVQNLKQSGKVRQTTEKNHAKVCLRFALKFSLLSIKMFYYQYKTKKLQQIGIVVTCFITSDILPAKCKKKTKQKYIFTEIRHQKRKPNKS